MKKMKKTSKEGLEVRGVVVNKLVNTYGGDFQYEMTVNGLSIEEMFKMFEGKMVTLRIEA
ncbi:hypothetical protein [Bacillus thuringiensis]|uniref:hypothetical protein n=1 Tax=Bacillus cereus group TaxID=86661 RepID=UPI000BF313F3|nr:hypothetical protein [Bacillus thuringiensis]MDM5370407.1 hypothetical protein [Bacillus bombysepticus]PEV64119.1 hypothetical protein CN434_25260 [Bacillus thuringiensis]